MFLCRSEPDSRFTLQDIFPPRIWRLFGAHFGGHGVCFPNRGRRRFGWRGAKKPELAKVLCENSGADVEWLMDKFNLDLSLVGRLGGHSAPRAHRGKERFPNMTITYAFDSDC